ncbi:MAG: polysaccharide deacetylase family protein [Ferruginibacter sp.]
MLLIYTENSTTRLQYICRFIFSELGIGYSLTTHLDSFKQHDGERLLYAENCDSENCIHIKPYALLFEDGIRKQDVSGFDFNGRKAFFKTEGDSLGFDIFAASFYLLSRYEEYLPHEKDEYGRYAHTNSVAFKEGFLNIPLVNFWIKDFGSALNKLFPSVVTKENTFSFLPTYDIDIAFLHKEKGLLRNIGGLIKHPSLNRIKILLGGKADEYAAYDFLDLLHQEKKLSPIYFFLVSAGKNKYDKNISPYAHGMWQLMKRHAKLHRVGLHPSWGSNEDIKIIQQEKKILETATGYNITDSRQHYIKFTLPKTFEQLTEVGITDDYSMGYGSINGFRASVASSFFWYNLTEEKVSTLQLHPFCFMDANSFYEQKQNAEEALEELTHYENVCKEVNGVMITIFHNQFLGKDKTFAGWKEMYSKFIAQVQP